MPSIEITTNRLTNERSPYLRSASRQAVHWYPWAPEAFQEAQRLARPILLDIGAVWCHWCHVMDRESYDNEEIAKIVNEHFVAIKVDRDERPDIDSRYQLAASTLTGQGGWPLTAFLTPQGEVFYAGTYFPPEDRYGQPGFKRILKRIAELYRTRKEDILSHVQKISTLFENSTNQTLSPGIPGKDFVENCLSTLKHHFDFAHGGFGNAPKFFHPSALELLLNRYHFTQESWLRAVIEKTLEAMGKGGVYDQLGGGFHRYSVDERWVVPHFEKMSYDNAALLIVYSKAFRYLEKSLYREIASGIIRWADEVLTDQERGGFYASQDADVNLHDEGDYYTWTRREVETLLTPEEARVILPYFDIDDQGEMLHDPSRNVLFVAQKPEILARELELKPQEVIQQLESAKRKLLRARGKRKMPFVDQTLYTNWNGLWVRAYLTAYRAFEDTRLRDFALKTLDRLMEKGVQPEKGMTRFLSENFVDGFLEDQVEILAASVEAFETTGTQKYLDFSIYLAQTLSSRYADSDGGFYDTPETKKEGHLRFREKRIQDSPHFSANAVAVRAFLKLFYLTGGEDFQERVEASLRFFHEEAKELSYFAASFVVSCDLYLKGPLKVVITGNPEVSSFDSLLKTALFSLHPYLVIIPLVKKSNDRAAAQICSGKTCLPATDSSEELAQQIRKS